MSSTLAPSTPDRRPFAAMLTAQTVSNAGTVMTFLAVPWFVLQTTGSAGRAGAAAFAEGVAFAVSAAFAGLIVDRVGARRTSIASDLVAGLAIAGVPVLHLTIGLQFWQLLVLVAVAALVRAPGDTAREVLLPDLAERGAVGLERAVSLADGVARAARLLGGPAAGVLIATLGPADVLLVDAGTFIFSAVLFGAYVPRGARMVDDEAPGTHWLADLREGLGFLVHQPLLRAVVLMVLVTNALDAANGSVLQPVYARQVLHSSVGLGLMTAVFGGGAVVGALAYSAVGHRLPRRWLYTVAFLVVGGPRFALLAATDRLWLVLVGYALIGVLCGAINPILSSVTYELVPVALRGRVLGAISAGCYAAIPLGAAVTGWLVEQTGLRASLVTVGVAYLAVTLSPVLGRVWRQLDDQRGADGASAPDATGRPVSPAGETLTRLPD